MLRSFDSLSFRQLRARKLRALLTAFGIVLGVGMVFAVLLLVTTIRHTFNDLIDSAWGNTDLVVVPKNTGVMPQSTLSRARAVPGVRAAGPMVGSIFARLDSHGRRVKGATGNMLVAGYDPGAPAYDFKYLQGRPVRSGAEIVVERNWARDRGLKLGQTLRVAAPTGVVALHVVGVFRFSSGLSFGGQGLAGIPLPEARRLGDIPTGFHQIAIQASDRSAVDALRTRLTAALGPGVDVKTPSALGGDLGKQLQALNVVLYFFAGVALFVGGFLIMNSFNMTVLQRMREIGMLRTLGATRGMVVRSVLIEALAIGIVGSLLGLCLGAGLSLGLIALMKGLGVPVGNLELSAGAAIPAILVGLIATTLGALRPARRAGRIAPIQATLGLAGPRRALPVRRGLIGFALIVPGLVFGGSFWFSDQGGRGTLFAVAGIAGTMLMFVGMALASPLLIMPLVRLLAVPLRRLAPSGGRLAADAANSNPARTSATAVALTIGLSVIVVNSAMSASFLGTISDQIDQVYARDFTVSPGGTTIETSGGQAIAPAVAGQIKAMPGAGVVTPLRAQFLRLPKAASSQNGIALGVDPVLYPKVDLSPIAGASRTDAFRALARGGVIVNKGYQQSAGLHVGSTVPLRGPAGARDARVVGVLKVVAALPGQGMLMSQSTMAAVYGPTPDAQVLVKASSPAARAPLGRRIDALLLSRYPNLEASSAAEVKSRIQGEVNRQFNLFNAIVIVAVIVSLLGVVNTLAMSVIERTREIGVLRALGSSRWQVRGTMLDESLLITVAGAVAGIALGGVIGYVWVRGLDSLLPGISFHFPYGATAGVAIGAVVLGVLAAALPARRAARLEPVEALSYE